MRDTKQNTELYYRFLELLGLEKKKVSIEALSELICAHLSTIPFENISKLYYKKLFSLESLPSFKKYLNGISENNLGGTCYANNYFFYKLLKYLGYEVKLCGADMKESDVHLVIIATLGNKEYLIDVGNASPFLAPIPLYLKKDWEKIIGGDKYIIKPRNNKGYSRLERLRNGVQKHVYTAKPSARKIEYFNNAISNSYSPDSTFFNCLLITKYISGSFITIHNMELIESKQNAHHIQQIADINELEYLMEDIFGIPQKITSEVIKDINFSRNAWY